MRISKAPNPHSCSTQMRLTRRPFDPDPEITRNFSYSILAKTIQFIYKFWNLAIIFIIGNIIKTKSLSHCTFDLFNTNFPFGTTNYFRKPCDRRIWAFDLLVFLLAGFKIFIAFLTSATFKTPVVRPPFAPAVQYA